MSPTLEDIRRYPAVISITTAAQALGISRSQLYELIRRNQAPVKVLELGEVRGMRVVTSSLIALLEDK